MEIIKIKTELIIPNEYNPNVVPEDMMAKLRVEIAKKGLCEPIIVRQQGGKTTQSWMVSTAGAFARN